MGSLVFNDNQFFERLAKSLPGLHFCGAFLVYVLIYLFVASNSQLGNEISAGESPGFALIGEYLFIFMVLVSGYVIGVGVIQALWIRSNCPAGLRTLKLTAIIQFLCIGILVAVILNGPDPLTSIAAFFVLAAIQTQGYIIHWNQSPLNRQICRQPELRNSHAILFLVLLFLLNAIIAQLDPTWQRLEKFIVLDSGAEVVLQKIAPAVFSGITGVWFGLATLAIASILSFSQIRLLTRDALKGIAFYLPFMLVCLFYSVIALSALMVAIEWQVSKLGLRPAVFMLAFLLAAAGGALLSNVYLRVVSYLPQNQKRSAVGLVCVSIGMLLFYPVFRLVSTRPYHRGAWMALVFSIVMLCGMGSYVLLYGDLFNPWFTAFSYLKSILLKLLTIVIAGVLVFVYEALFAAQSSRRPGSPKHRALLVIAFFFGFIPFALLNRFPEAKTTLLQFSDLTRVDAAYARQLAGLFGLDKWVRLGQNPADNRQPHPWPHPWKLKKVRPSLLPKDFNLMVIVVDALRGDAFNSAGYHRNLTPFLDKWAKEEAISFRRAYSQGGGSFAAFPFLVAGRSRFTLYGPDLYKNNLYLKLAREEGIRRFMVMKGFGPRSIFPPDHPVSELTIPRAVSDRRTATAEEVFDSARAAISNIDIGERFLCFLHLMDVHNDLWKKPGGVDYGDSPRDIYDNNLSYLDRAFERFIEWMKSHYIYEKTVILFTSDHGEQFWEHGASLHGHTVYEEEIRIPAILFVPGLQRRFADVTVIAADMAPTITELAGYAIDPPYDDPHMGISLVPLILYDERPGYLQRDVVGRASFKRRYFLLRNWQWKYIYFAELDLVQLFNIVQDPLEKTNLVEDNLQLAAELELELLGYLQRVEGKTYRPLLNKSLVGK